MNKIVILGQTNEADPLIGLALIIGVCFICSFFSRPRKSKGYTVTDNRQISVTPRK